jgi:hypothetical protein
MPASTGSKELVCNPHSPSCRQLASSVPLEIPQPSVCNPHFHTRRRPASMASLEVPQPVCNSHSFVLRPQPLPSSFSFRAQRLLFSSSHDLLGQPRLSIRPCGKLCTSIMPRNRGYVTTANLAFSAWLSSDNDPERADRALDPGASTMSVQSDASRFRLSLLPSFRPDRKHPSAEKIGSGYSSDITSDGPTEGTAPWKVVSPTGGLVVELSSASIQAIESMAYSTDIKSIEDVWQNLTLTVALTSEPLTYWLKTKEAHPSAVALARAKSQSSQQDGEVTPGLIRRAKMRSPRV